MATFEPRIHSISADVGRLKEARDFADHAAADFGLGEDARYHVKLAMSEAVTNAIQHGSASARDEIRILALEEAGALVFEVTDDGKGFEPERTPPGSGLTNMRDRLEALGGSIEVSSRPGEGTSVSGRIPVHWGEPA